MSKNSNLLSVTLVLTAAIVVTSGVRLLAAGAGSLLRAKAPVVSDDGPRASVSTAGAADDAKIGFLIPSQCRPREGSEGPDGPYDEWPAPHTTECALAEACIASGYGLWVMEEKAFYRLDAAGQKLALVYFRTTERPSYNKVEIVGDFSDAEAVEIHEMTLTD